MLKAVWASMLCKEERETGPIELQLDNDGRRFCLVWSRKGAVVGVGSRRNVGGVSGGGSGDAAAAVRSRGQSRAAVLWRFC